MAPINRLGVFSRLPLEIRQQIWSEFQPQYLQGNQQLTILCTSSHIYEEVSTEIFKHQDFKIWIPARCGRTEVEDSDESPQPEDNPHTTITNNFYRLWQLESYQNAVSIGFGPQGFPWHKVPRIRIEIEAPSSDDGELICVYKRTRDLIELIERPGRNFKNIEILLKDTEETQWFRGRRIPEITEVGSDILGSEGEEIPHFEVILDLFNRLRNFNSAKVHTTQSPLRSGLGAPFERLQNVILVEPTPFGYFKKRTQSFDIDDKVTRQRLGDRYLMMERFLDNVPQAVEGRSSTANCLRLERFASWYSDFLHGHSKYETDIMDIICSGKRSLKELQLETFCLDHRYRLMRAYKPVAVHLWNEFAPSAEPSPAEASWDKDKWQREWPQGINGLEPVWDFVAANLPDVAFRSDIGTVLMLCEKAMVPFPNWYKWRFDCFLQAFPGVTSGPHEDFWKMNYFRDKVSERREDLENYHDLCQESMDSYGELAWPLRKEGEQLYKAMTPKEVRDWRGKFKRGLR
ncbi:hypothetical protein HYALB_00004060 [Hymenoscyphus albidus]|uniref:Uncharacterized protein n=1 Tax=Hymenoscyphus albidus TaxID=595503 RepID=A0A9N9LYH1_9HELO|nr:hypothetical protein HYALB_00004060 [Hymenoscyphus albidus]